MKKITYYCDVCGKELKPLSIYRGLMKISASDFHQGTYQVIFNTDQNDGHVIAPYVVQQNIEICTECKNKILLGKVLYGSGAQGYNTYHFEEEK